MKTGSDISLRTCRAEGYAVVIHGKKPMDPDEPYDLSMSEPRYWPNGRLIPGTRSKHAYRVSMFISYNDLWESFLRGGEAIKKFCDFEKCPYPSPDQSPTFTNFCHLAQTVQMFHGLE